MTETFLLFLECLEKFTIETLSQKLNVHIQTIKRWLCEKKIPDSYYSDLIFFTQGKYLARENFRDKDQFYTTKSISKYCYTKTLECIKELSLNEEEYFYIEPSAGCCNFLEILPKNRRIGIDIEPKGELKDELIEKNYLDFFPEKNKKYIVIGNPPFGLRGNLALRFINHSSNFADVVAFILPPLFNSSGKGVPKKRVQDYQLFHSENLPPNSFEYPNGQKVSVATIFQVWTKVNIDKIKKEKSLSCKKYLKIFSLSDGGTPSTTRNREMIDRCDGYLPSTCFSGMKSYTKFNQLPYKRGYGIIFLKNENELKDIFFNQIKWIDYCFLSTNNAMNLRMELIEKAFTDKGFCDDK